MVSVLHVQLLQGNVDLWLDSCWSEVLSNFFPERSQVLYSTRYFGVFGSVMISVSRIHAPSLPWVLQQGTLKLVAAPSLYATVAQLLKRSC